MVNYTEFLRELTKLKENPQLSDEQVSNIDALYKTFEQRIDDDAFRNATKVNRDEFIAWMSQQDVEEEDKGELMPFVDACLTALQKWHPILAYKTPCYRYSQRMNTAVSLVSRYLNNICTFKWDVETIGLNSYPLVTLQRK